MAGDLLKRIRSSKEKVLAALNRTIGVVPIIPLSITHSATLLGIKIPAMRRDAKLNVEAQVKAWEKYRYDGIVVYSDMGMFWESMGGKIKLSEDSFPSQEPMLARLEDAERLNFPDLEKEGSLKETLRALEGINDKVGEEVAVLIDMVAPFTFAGALRGMDLFMMEIVRKPDLAENLLTRCHDFLIAYVDELKRRGALIIVFADPMASLIRPSMYERFALPYQKSILQKIRANGMYSVLHICGDTTAILGEMGTSGSDCLGLDHRVDLKYARKMVGSLCLKGSVDPIGTLLRGSVDDVEREARKCIEDAAEGGGFILSAGCGIPAKTSSENMEALVRVARSHSP